MGFLGWIIIGIIAGFVAEKVTKSDHGLFTNLGVGLVGAFVGGYLADLLKLDLTGGFIDTMIVATVGAILVLFVYQKIKS
ncbi:MAG: GlsB/YeaQ/YmgE family stress response membrane protein [Cohaesibacter sp.]|nr:GlsB/YeaQ/YmgE family stress response membrane protein [Cohaesibacter sp.]